MALPRVALLVVAAVCVRAQVPDTTWDAPARRALQLQREGRHAEAERILLDAWTHSERNRVEERQTATFCLALGYHYQAVGRYGDAERFYRKALKLWSAPNASSSVGMANTVNALLNLFLSQQRLHTAAAIYGGPIKARMETLPRDPLEAVKWRIRGGAILVLQGKLQEARPILEECLRALESSDGPDSSELVGTLNNLGLVHFRAGRLETALRCFERANSVAERDSTFGPAGSVGPLLNVAYIYAVTGQHSEADARFRRVFHELAAACGAGPPAHGTGSLTIRCQPTAHGAHSGSEGRG